MRRIVFVEEEREAVEGAPIVLKFMAAIFAEEGGRKGTVAMQLLHDEERPRGWDDTPPGGEWDLALSALEAVAEPGHALF